MVSRTSKKEDKDLSLKTISPNISAKGSSIRLDGITTGADLIETMQFLFIRIVRARYFPVYGAGYLHGVSGHNPYVEVKLGSFKGTTLCSRNLEWNQVFTLAREQIKESTFEVLVKDLAMWEGEAIGQVSFNISEIPERFPPDSPLAPQWYGLTYQKQNERKHVGEFMMSVWTGTQADEAFHDAWHLDATPIEGGRIAHTGAQVYIAPRPWILRIHVIQAQDLLVENTTEDSRVFLKANYGGLTSRTEFIKGKNASPKWNEDLLFAALPPYDEQLVLSIEYGTSTNHKSLGSCVIPLKDAAKRIDASAVGSKWYKLEMPKTFKIEEAKIAGKVNIKLSLDSGYHIFEEDPLYSSDYNATGKRLWKPSIGVLELGILGATGLSPMKAGKRTDAYCVAKYGQKWVRTRTVINSLSPKWNEQYSWDVYNASTFINIVVMDNGYFQGVRDERIGKLHIALFNLEANRVYTFTYPLIELQPSGLKKKGEIQLALRFSASITDLLHAYILPLLPRLHYLQPLSSAQYEILRKQVGILLSSRFSQAEPPLVKEAVDYMLEKKDDAWSMRRARVNFNRISVFMDALFAIRKWSVEVLDWKNPPATLFFYLFCCLVIWNPRLLLNTAFPYLVWDGISHYLKRKRLPDSKHLTCMDTKLSLVDTTSQDEFEEEFDPIPSMYGEEIIRRRYDRLRPIMGRIVLEIGVWATIGEKIDSLLSWRDCTATLILLMSCLFAGIWTLFIPFKYSLFCFLTYLLLVRHPRFRSPLPTMFQNMLRRMPSKLDSML